MKRFRFDNPQLPKLFMRALCQNSKCHEIVGGFHMPCSGGSVVFTCQACGGVSLFVNGATGYTAKFVPDIGVSVEQTVNGAKK